MRSIAPASLSRQESWPGWEERHDKGVGAVGQNGRSAKSVPPCPCLFFVNRPVHFPGKTGKTDTLTVNTADSAFPPDSSSLRQILV